VNISDLIGSLMFGFGYWAADIGFVEQKTSQILGQEM
jgi:hypothetical protein